MDLVVFAIPSIEFGLKEWSHNAVYMFYKSRHCKNVGLLRLEFIQ